MTTLSLSWINRRSAYVSSLQRPPLRCWQGLQWVVFTEIPTESIGSGRYRCRNKRRKSDEVIHCIWCDNSNDKTDLGLGSDTANGVSVVINFADMRGAKSGSRFMHVDPSKIGKTPRGLVFAFNPLWGGSGLIAGADWDNDVQADNVWAP